MFHCSCSCSLLRYQESSLLPASCTLLRYQESSRFPSKTHQLPFCGDQIPNQKQLKAGEVDFGAVLGTDGCDREDAAVGDLRAVGARVCLLTPWRGLVCPGLTGSGTGPLLRSNNPPPPPLSLFHLCWEESQERASRDGVVSPGGRERGESNSPQTCNALDF